MNPTLLPIFSTNSNSNSAEHLNFIPSNLSKGDVVILDEADDVNVGCVDDDAKDADEVVLRSSLRLVSVAIWWEMIRYPNVEVLEIERKIKRSGG